MLSLRHGLLVSIGHLDPELVVGGSWAVGLTVGEESPALWRVGGRVEDHVVGHDGDQKGMLLLWLMNDVYERFEREVYGLSLLCTVYREVQL